MSNDHDSLTTAQLAKRWQIAEGTLRNRASLGKPPRPLRIGRSVRYRIDVIERYEKRSLKALSKHIGV